MREILFRGKRLDNGEWVEGACFPASDPYPATIFHGKHNALGEYVEAETVGQFTGLLDKHGTRIFEGDIFEWGYAGFKEFRYVVVYDANIASFVGERHFGFVTLNGIDIEIIGNIYDNPEPLEVTPDE